MALLLAHSPKATTDKGVEGYNPADSRYKYICWFSWQCKTSTLAAVSMGDGKNATRQITGLAAGKEDTDAVNVSSIEKR